MLWLLMIWMVISILMYYGYRRYYESYMQKVLMKQAVRFKYPSMRIAGVIWMIISLLVISTAAKGLGQVKQSQRCLLQDPQEALRSYQGVESYDRQLNEFLERFGYGQNKDGSQSQEVFTKMEQIGDGVRIMMTQFQGQVFVALRIDRPMTEHEEAYYLALNYAGGSQYQMLENKGDSFGVSLIYPLDCYTFDLNIDIYTVTKEKKETPYELNVTYHASEAVLVK